MSFLWYSMPMIIMISWWTGNYTAEWLSCVLIVRHPVVSYPIVTRSFLPVRARAFVMFAEKYMKCPINRLFGACFHTWVDCSVLTMYYDTSPAKEKYYSRCSFSLKNWFKRQWASNYDMMIWSKKRLVDWKTSNHFTNAGLSLTKLFLWLSSQFCSAYGA